MKILCLDTAMAACSAAVIDTEQPRPLAEAFAAMERGHAEALAPMAAEVMQSAGFDFSRLDRIAVTTGPGTFTGVRIGLSFARGLGLARGIPVVGIDSLSAIAANETSEAPLLIAADARNDEIYAAVFDAARRLITPPHITTAQAVCSDLPAGAMVLGTASVHVIAASGRHDILRSAAGDLPVAARFGALASGAAPASMPGPLYLRAPDAKPQSAPLRQVGTLTIETVGAEASELLSVLHAESFDGGWSAKAFADLLATPGAEAAIATELGSPQGFVLTRRAADEAEIITIGTRPSLQRRGVARQLLERHVANLTARGVRHLFLEVAASNIAAQALYGGLGFREAGRRKGYYRHRDGAEDAIVMRRELAP